MGNGLGLVEMGGNAPDQVVDHCHLFEPRWVPSFSFYLFLWFGLDDRDRRRLMRLMFARGWSTLHGIGEHFFSPSPLCYI